MTEKSFEDTLQHLEHLVETLANEGVSLKDALAAYEESQQLIQEAEKTLADAEQKVLQLTQNGTEFALEAFETESP